MGAHCDHASSSDARFTRISFECLAFRRLGRLFDREMRSVSDREPRIRAAQLRQRAGALGIRSIQSGPYEIVA